MKNTKRKNIKEEVLQLICEYWNRKLVGDIRHDNGDKTGESTIAMMLADILAGNNKVSKEQLDIFDKELKNQIINRECDYLETYCDYGPGVYLHEAAEKANINFTVFPFKTGITFSNDTVIESLPYSKKSYIEKIIYCNRQYIEERIQSANKSLEKYRKEKYKYWDSKEECENYYAKILKELNDFANSFSDIYIREDFKDFYNSIVNNGGK